ncbi:sensor histidine kinase [Microbispora amethystogenes]|uniref:Signal transduction histidine-protein kinase/phosphatase MprB n=1 Tax=Microbispora amethystogenes TaxID=1427754 RepID=A0ABQ4FC49_9ACTN|nr:HAMP domain-containing sensor histidine kinase [Microbispora amethystogenes]GIH32349.1 two-component sensor histidine kinase [Microbispora amethystogenes]
MRRWLAALVAATTSLVLVSLLVPLALLVRSVARSEAIGSATRAAESVAVAVGAVDEDTLRLTAEQAGASSGHPVTVFLADGRVLGAPAARTPAVELAARGRSLTASAPGGREILVAVQGAPGGTAVIRAFLADEDLDEGVHRTWLALLVLGIVLVGVGMLVADRLARAIVGPTTALAEVSHHLATGDLTARARPQGPPEVRTAGLALNHLAERISDLLAEEREMVADVSHRLRTPLTGLRLEAESLSDPGEAARIEARVDALERAVTVVINDVRRRSRERASCDAVPVVRYRVAFWSVLAEDQSRTVTLDLAAGPLRVAASADDLAACVDALVGNVFAHTPDGASFRVRLAARGMTGSDGDGTDGRGGGVLLTVSDAGPGFGPGDPSRRGESGAGSTGLGLDIARRVAEQSGGRLTLGDSDLGGAEVRLLLGIA